ncbi:hypothetical protein EML15_03940 [Corynebacterium sp. sy017]|uniref:hypothetical protein n=1 Tax=unclassified Corynebacterium TaxID=2624378 RepID=UPI001184F873|nr:MULTISPECIES: hypothetical protein [unclassified Corynebacterium]MBP3088298.1 hypothetical protein [Corynebacterium sp. sy017]TSD91622.1 hypothetical protein ELY17_03940 [Corynebacterium sp. SY003]
MNKTVLFTALRSLKHGYKSFSRYRSAKARQAYEALLDAAATHEDTVEKIAGSVSDTVQASKENMAELYQGSSKQAASLIAQYRKRLEKAASEAAAKKEELAKAAEHKAQKTSKKLSKASKKAQKKATQRADLVKAKVRGEKPRASLPLRLVRSSALIAAIVAVIAVATNVVRNKLNPQTNDVHDEPPRVEDHQAAKPESTLVYSTQTPETPEQEHIPSPEEGVSERDEQLLNALDEQIGKHRLAEQETEKEAEQN